MNSPETVAAWAGPLLILAAGGTIMQSAQTLSGDEVPPGVDRRLYLIFRNVARVLGSFSCAIGLVVLAGWILGVGQWQTIIPGASTIRMNSALCMVLAGFAIQYSQDRPRSLRTAIGHWCGIAVALIGLLTIAEYVFGMSLGIDELFFRDTGWLAPGAMPGRISFTTAVVYVLLGSAIALLRPGRWCPVVAQYLALTAWATCFVTLAGYLYGANVVSGFASRVVMSLPGSLICCFLCAGVLLSFPHRGPMKVLVSRAPGGTLARLLLPAALVLPYTIGYLRWLGQEKGLYDTAFGLALFASANTVIFVALILGTAALLNRLDGQRTHAEIHRQQTEAQYRTLVESLPQIVWSATPNGRCDYLSHRWYEYTGIDAARSMGLRWTRVVHEADRAANTRLWMEAVKTGKPFDSEYRVIGADGNYRWFRAVAIPMRDESGAVVKWFGTSMDVEDRKRDEDNIRHLNEHLEERVDERTRELADTEEKLRGVFRAATRVAFIATSAEGKIQVFNTGAEIMLGYTETEMLGKSPMVYHDVEEVEERRAGMSVRLGRIATIAEVFRGGSEDGPGSEDEWTYTRKGGEKIDVLLGLNPIRNASGELQGYLGVSTDITARKRLERELRHKNQKLASETKRAEAANQAKSDFLATMSHEIRTPMNAILGMADLLAESKLDPEQRTCVEVFQRAGTSLMCLINDILDLSKIEAGRMELEQADFDIRAVLSQVVELTGARAAAKGLALRTDVADDLPPAITGDAMRLRQILINLVGNAIKFTDHGEVAITVAFARAGVSGEIAFAVTDTGIGIPEAKREAIFESFTQADSSTTRKYGGTGLGLTISRRLVESMGGRIEVNSQLGKGSEFRFTAVFGMNAGPAPRPQVSMEDLRGCRVMVIDDDPANLLFMRHLMTSWGMAVTEFTSAQSGIASLRDDPATFYSLVIVDGEMPGMDGFGAAAGISSLRPGLPVLMLSSGERSGDADRSRREGLAGFAAKPVEKTDLLRMIRQSVRLATAPKPDGVSGRSVNSSRSFRILAAEDSLDNQMLLKMYLKDEPHELTFVENGAAAVEQRRVNHFDIIMMDMQMPVMDGLTATKIIRQMERERNWPPIPIVALTANASPDDIEKSWEAGCDGHLTKPVKRARVLRVLEEYLGTERVAPTPAAATPAREIQAGFGEMLKDLMPDYIKSVRQDVAGARALLAGGEIQALRRLGHNFKGTSGMFGFQELGKIGDALEVATMAGDLAAQTQCIAELERIAESMPS
jgi:two-component system sensor histidine kinase/response regulator